MKINETNLTIEQLPQSLQEIAKVIGVEATMDLVRHFGGTRLHFAKTSCKAFTKVAEVVGIDKALILGETFNDNELYLPTAYHALKKIERTEMIRRYNEMLANKLSARVACNDLAREFGKSCRQVENIVNSAA